MNTDQIYNLIAENLPIFVSHLIHSIVILFVFGILYKICGQKGTLVKSVITKMGLEENDPIGIVFSKILRIIVFIVGLLSFAQEWGFNLSAVIASLGIGSLALALAAQDSVKNFFGAFIILVEKPFKVGDKISTGGMTGIVQEINFRSTIIKAEGGEITYIPNANLSGAPITNFSKK
ncbi:MAG: mechanosensitive ion channel family protein [Acidaminococcaceae bacterium]|nr:mechanosensitive ion channel family protein [Acidaminococcaceae bacterium]